MTVSGEAMCVQCLLLSTVLVHLDLNYTARVTLQGLLSTKVCLWLSFTIMQTILTLPRFFHLCSSARVKGRWLYCVVADSKRLKKVDGLWCQSSANNEDERIRLLLNGFSNGQTYLTWVVGSLRCANQNPICLQIFFCVTQFVLGEGCCVSPSIRLLCFQKGA